MSSRTARGNRLGIAIVGVLLVLAGAAALAKGLDAWPSVLGHARSVITTGQVRRYADSQHWFWPVAGAAAIAIVLLALRWLIVQARSDATTTIAFEHNTQRGATAMPASAATSALEDELTAGPYIKRASATLSGPASALRLALSVTITTGSDPATAIRRVSEAVSRLRSALESDELNATVRISATSRQ